MGRRPNVSSTYKLRQDEVGHKSVCLNFKQSGSCVLSDKEFGQEDVKTRGQRARRGAVLPRPAGRTCCVPFWDRCGSRQAKSPHPTHFLSFFHRTVKANRHYVPNCRVSSTFFQQLKWCSYLWPLSADGISLSLSLALCCVCFCCVDKIVL